MRRGATAGLGLSGAEASAGLWRRSLYRCRAQLGLIRAPRDRAGKGPSLARLRGGDGEGRRLKASARDGEDHMMRIYGVRTAGPAVPGAFPAKMTGRFFYALRVQIHGGCPGGEEGAAISPGENDKKAGPQRVACAWRARRDGAALLPPTRVWGCSGGGCGACEGSPPPPAPHVVQLGAGTPLEFGERERCSEGCRRECTPSPDQDFGGRGGRGGLDAEEGWRWGVGGNEGVTHPPWISQRMEGRVGGAGTGRGSHEEEG